MSFYAQKILEKSDVNGMFHFQNLAIDLKYIGRNFIEPGFNGNDIDTFEKAVELRSIMIHEYQHYLDSTHTVWGVDYLFDLERAYSHFDDPQRLLDENSFIELMQLYEKLNSIVLPEYYQLNLCNDVKKIEKDLLKLEPTIGNIFTKYGEVGSPCFFVNYIQKHERLVRSPVSIITLLECSAIIEEISYRYAQILIELKDHHLYKTISENQFKKHIESIIYNPDLSEYFSLILLVSQKIKDFKLLEDVWLIKILIQVCLNFTSEHFSELLKSQFMMHVLKNCNPQVDGGDFYEKLKKGIESEDRGMLFLAISLLLPSDMNYKNPKFCKDVINTILRTIREELTFDLLQSEAREYIETIAESLKDSVVPYIAKIAKSIKFNLAIIHGDPDVFPPAASNAFKKNYFNGGKLSLMDLPACTLDDLDIIGLYTEGENSEDPKWILKFASLETLEQDINDLSDRFLKVEKFVVACVD